MHGKSWLMQVCTHIEVVTTYTAILSLSGLTHMCVHTHYPGLRGPDLMWKLFVSCSLTYWTDSSFGPGLFCGGKVFAHVRNAFLASYLVRLWIIRLVCLVLLLPFLNINHSLSPNYKVHYHYSRLTNQHGCQDTSKHRRVSFLSVRWLLVSFLWILILAIHYVIMRV